LIIAWQKLQAGLLMAPKCFPLKAIVSKGFWIFSKEAQFK
jgi:hypothetical protein